MTAYTDVTVAVQNIPGNKPELRVPPAQRGDVMLGLFNEAGVDIACLTEVFDDVRDDIKRRRNWTYTETPPNQRTPRRGAVGNEIAWRNRVLVLGTDVQRLKWKRPLNLPVVYATLDGASFMVQGVHLPTKRDANRIRRALMLRAVVNNAVRVHKSGMPVIVGGDWNRTDVLAAFPRGWHIASARHVDIIVCSPDVKVREHGYRLDGVKGVISDHPMVTATVAVPVKKECK